MSHHIVPCRTVSHHVVPCHTMSHRVSPCRAMSRHVTPCSAVSCRVPPCHAMSHHVPPCYIMSCHVTPCRAVSHHVAPCRTMSHCVSPCPTVSHHVVPCRTVSQRVPPCRTVSRHVAPCPTMSHHVAPLRHSPAPHCPLAAAVCLGCVPRPRAAPARPRSPALAALPGPNRRWSGPTGVVGGRMGARDHPVTLGGPSEGCGRDDWVPGTTPQLFDGHQRGVDVLPGCKGPSRDSLVAIRQV